MNKKILIMKTNSNNLRKAQIIMNCVLIAFFGISSVTFLTQGWHTEAIYNILLVLAWIAVLLKDLENARYVKLINLYKEVTKENDEFLDKLVNYINEKQKYDDTDNQR